MKSIALAQNFNRITQEMEQCLYIILATDDKFSGEMLYLDLLGVRNLRIHQPSLSLINLGNIEICKAPVLGNFERRFVVLDAEQEAVFVCSCHDFSHAVG